MYTSKMLKLLIVLSVIASPFIWNSDLFQKLVFPKSYWDREIAGLERMKESFKKGSVNCALELEKLQRTVDLDLSKLRIDGATTEEAGQIWRAQFELQAKTCKTLGQMYSDYQKEIVSAKRERLRATLF